MCTGPTGGIPALLNNEVAGFWKKNYFWVAHNHRPCVGNYMIRSGCLSNHFFTQDEKKSEDGDCKSSLNNCFQCLTVLAEKKTTSYIESEPLLIHLISPHHTPAHLWRNWLHLIEDLLTGIRKFPLCPTQSILFSRLSKPNSLSIFSHVLSCAAVSCHFVGSVLTIFINILLISESCHSIMHSPRNVK